MTFDHPSFLPVEPTPFSLVVLVGSFPYPGPLIHCPFYAISWQKLLADQRRLKREQEEADIAARRHTGVIPTHHQFITNERFGDLLNIDDTAKRKSGSEVCFGCLDLLLDPKQHLPPFGVAFCRPN